MQTRSVRNAGYATVGTRDPGQRMVEHRRLSDDRLVVECGPRLRLNQAQGSVVGLFPGFEARAIPGRSRESRELSVRLRTALLGMVEYGNGLSLEQVPFDRWTTHEYGLA